MDSHSHVCWCHYPRHAIRKRGLCCRPVSIRLSVRPSCWWIVSTQLKISSNFLFRRVTPSLWFLNPHAPIPNSKVTSSAGVQNTRGWEMLAIFDWNRRLSLKRCEVGPWLLWNVNMKSWLADRSVSVPTTLSDLWSGFQGHDIFFKIEHLKNSALYG